jgi:hypothetical protein
MVVYDHLGASKKAWCECCGEQGHKFYECPERLLGNSSSIYCSICGSNNHPSADCPDKSKISALLIIKFREEESCRGNYT